MQVEKIPRIGIAVKDLEKAKDFFINVLGAKRGIVFQRDETKSYEMVEDEIPSEGLKSYYLTMGGLQIELMSPTDEDGNIANFIKRKGEGLMTRFTPPIVSCIPRISSESWWNWPSGSKKAI